MARRISLRAFQEHLAERLSSAARGPVGSGLLGVQAGGEHWLLDLPDSGEIVSLPPLATVPLTFPWFAGLANVRGNLYAVTDFSAFASGEPTPVTGAARLLLVGVRHGSNAALLVSRILGLRNAGQFTPLPLPDTAAPWETGRFADAEGRNWRRLDVRRLLADPAFMEIGI
ncbi:MAG: chemotaxis protein CheW [Azospira sp.]|jgi:twitching motility protein PilI|nr:chemotaxis protein CheW [Azospira sp.]